MVQESMTPTEITQAARLLDQLEAYLKPTKPGQYVVVVERRFLVKVAAALVAHDAERLGEVEQQDGTKIVSS